MRCNTMNLKSNIQCSKCYDKMNFMTHFFKLLVKKQTYNYFWSLN